MTLATFPELKKLSRSQKMKLADELWLEGVSDRMPVTAGQKKLLDSRWAAYKGGQMKRIPLGEMKRRLKAK